MNQCVIYTDGDGNLCVMIPAPSYKGTLEYLAAKHGGDAVDAHEIVDRHEIPSDRTFRNAWKRGEQGKKVGIEMGKAKGITHELRRAKRDAEMKPHDEVVAKQIPGQNAQQAEQARKVLRTKFAQIQDDIDACSTPEELKAIIDTELQDA